MNRIVLIARLAIVGLIVLFGSFRPLRGQAAPPASSPPNPPPAKAAAIGDLAWLEGAWMLQRHDETLIETWGPPDANAMAGMFRWSRGGKVWMYELMTITQEPAADGASGGGLTFRLRHFDAKLTPWEKDGPLTYGVVRSKPNEVVFEDPAREDPRRFIYRRDGDNLTVRLEAADGSGQEFTFSK